MTVYKYTATSLAGEEVPLETWRGRVLLIVNTASKCGFTGQYAGLQALYEKYQARGLTVLGFPCNQFGGQEPGGEAQIRDFCSTRYGITFPLFTKVDVNGAKAHPLWQYLKSAQPGLLGSEGIKWNFTKFLVDRNGEVQRRFAPKDHPEDLDPAIAAALI